MSSPKTFIVLTRTNVLICVGTFFKLKFRIKKSSEFWLPTERGGTGEGFEIYQKLHARNRTLRESVRRCDVGIIVADATSASGGLIIGATIAGVSAGLLSWTFPAAVFLGAAWASATSALYNCPI